MKIHTKWANQEPSMSVIALATLATFDLVSTLMWMNQGFDEGNPVFAALAQHGSIAFALAKVVLVALPILVLERARQEKPLFAERATWLAFGLYAALYVGHLVTLQSFLTHRLGF